MTVTRILLANPELAKRWHAHNHARLQTAARKQWLAVLRKNPAAGIKEARAKAAAAYAWLYRNDRAWLQEQNQRLPNKVSGNHSTVNWTERDHALSERIREQFDESSGTRGSGQLRRGQIIQMIPELYPKLRKLHNLPVTRATLDSLLSAIPPKNHH